jgi:glycine/D-amino acid oxidase-like deaminating enzyme
MVTDQMRDGYDVVVVGGGAAGLSGALMLARARRQVIDAGAPRNAPAAGVRSAVRCGYGNLSVRELNPSRTRRSGAPVGAGRGGATAHERCCPWRAGRESGGHHGCGRPRRFAEVANRFAAASSSTG